MCNANTRPRRVQRIPLVVGRSRAQPPACMPAMIPDRFHPTIKRWFEARFGDATPCQREAWEHIGAGQHTLACAPTRSGKTLAASLHGIDELIAERERGPLPDLTRIIYVSPPKGVGPCQADRTTLVFANTRRLTERLAHHLGERLGTEAVTAHHGSLSQELRLDAERRLKQGELTALITTASLELGPNIGDVVLVVQISSPRSISTFLQRVARSGQHVDRIPKGRLVPLSRDDLSQCVALLSEVHLGNLDELRVPVAPLDVLAQQLVAIAACETIGEDELLTLSRLPYPYQHLTQPDFEAVIAMLSDSFTTRRGRRGAYLHRGGINAQVRGRKHARLTALANGGAIAEMADYRGVLEPAEVFIGTLNEDFAIDSLRGDIFQRGNSAWRVLKVEPGRVPVEDAQGQPPTLPFWLGEAPARTGELSSAIAAQRARIKNIISQITPDLASTTSPNPSHIHPQKLTTSNTDSYSNANADAGPAKADSYVNAVVRELERSEGLSANAPERLAAYLVCTYFAFGKLPTQDAACVERFFDEAGRMQLVIHAPFGACINRAWGQALRKRFCRRFNFELQAAATNHSIVLSLGQTHRFPLDDIRSMLSPDSIADVLAQAVLDSPMFTARWRWNANVFLAIPRRGAGKKVPPPIQRMQAEDLIAVVFPDQLTCAENLQGEREIPDHPPVNQTLNDALRDAMDLDGVTALVGSIRASRTMLRTADATEPSPFSAEILDAKPYAFLDDAPLEERRIQAVMSPRWLDPRQASDIGRLDENAIQRVCQEARTSLGSSPGSIVLGLVWGRAASTTPSGARTADDIHDALLCVGFMSDAELAGVEMSALTNSGRATRLVIGTVGIWCATERWSEVATVHPKAPFQPPVNPPPKYRRECERDTALLHPLRSRLESSGPCIAEEIACALSVNVGKIKATLAQLEVEGFALRGQFTASAYRDNATQWHERRLLARIHRYTIEGLRREVAPVSAAQFMQFLFSWHDLGPGQARSGPRGLQAALSQLEDFQASGPSWESEILPSRVTGYSPLGMDSLCLSGQIAWLQRGEANAERGPKATIGFVPRANLRWCSTHSQTANERIDICAPTSRRVL
ncbi:MAG: ATP-dependent Lhr-like helicase, partial [Gammaproteobacteria bacterium]